LSGLEAGAAPMSPGNPTVFRRALSIDIEPHLLEDNNYQFS
jgi:hypothetical protein